MTFCDNYWNEFGVDSVDSTPGAMPLYSPLLQALSGEKSHLVRSLFYILNIPRIHFPPLPRAVTLPYTLSLSAKEVDHLATYLQGDKRDEQIVIIIIRLSGKFHLNPSLCSILVLSRSPGNGGSCHRRHNPLIQTPSLTAAEDEEEAYWAT